MVTVQYKIIDRWLQEITCGWLFSLHPWTADIHTVNDIDGWEKLPAGKIMGVIDSSDNKMYCSKCGYIYKPDQTNGVKRLDPVERKKQVYKKLGVKF